MEYYDTSLQDAIDQYTRGHELTDPHNAASVVIPYSQQNVLQPSGRIIHTQLTNLQHVHQPQPLQPPGVLMHTSGCVYPATNVPLQKKDEEVTLDFKVERSDESQVKKIATVPKKRKRVPQVPNENKKAKKRTVLKKKAKSKIPYADNPQRYRNKIQRELGLEYQGHVKVNDKWEKIEKQSKKLKGRCNCKYSKSNSETKIKCGSVTDEEREKIFNSFWKLSWKEKRLYVRLMVNIKPVANRTVKKESRRLKSLEIHLKCEDRFVRVCKKMFLQTLCLSEWALKDWIRVGESSEVKKSKELKHEEEVEATQPEQEAAAD